MIFDFASWVIDENDQAGLKIFIEDLPEVEELPRAKVYDFLYKNHKALALPYLEHVIYEWKDSNALFHNALAVLYKDKIIRLAKELEASPSNEELNFEYLQARSKLQNFLKFTRNCTAEAVLVQYPYDCKVPLLTYAYSNNCLKSLQFFRLV